MAGLPPQYWLSTAIVTPVITALFGSSWHLVSGATLAISAVVFSTSPFSSNRGPRAYIEAAPR
jgi:SulP family sulfate permease